MTRPYAWGLAGLSREEHLSMYPAMPERRQDPPEPDSNARPRPVPLCACGRAVSIRGLCVWCVHGITPPESS